MSAATALFALACGDRAPSSPPTTDSPSGEQRPAASAPVCPFDRSATIRVQSGMGSVIPDEGETISGNADGYDPVEDEPTHSRITVTLEDGVVSADGYVSERRNAPLDAETSTGRVVVLPNPYECLLPD